ncbi:MAG TPA: hypothetical protein VGF69_17260 [Thermoanaerobaculia bacterium]|jgi:hypothetical protein
MITKSDWQTAYDDIIEDGRARLGPPPTVEKIEALRDGKLQEDEAERVREMLAHYPDLVRALTAPFPRDGAGLVTDEEVAAGMARLKERVHREAEGIQPPVRVETRRPVRRILARAAAVVVLVGGAALAYRMVNRFDGVPVLLSADGQLAAPSRSAGQTPHQLSTETDYLLKPAFRPAQPYRAYQLELFDLSDATPRSIRAWRGIERVPDGSFPVELSTHGLGEGRYRLVLYGIDEKPVPLASYTIRLTAP